MSYHQAAFDTSFHRDLLHPKWWGSWVTLGLLALFAFIPVKIRDKFADVIAPLILKFSKKQSYIAEVNLKICFPELGEDERRALLLKTIRIGVKTILGFGELTWRSSSWLMARYKVTGWEHIDAQLTAGRLMILVVPHTWAIERVGRYFMLQGMSMCTMMKSPKNAVFNWYINRERAIHGGTIFERSAGIKPVVKAIRGGNHFFYLPDQDHGREISIFVPFFGYPKATLPALPKLVKLTGATAIPIFASYDEEQHCYRLDISPPLDPYPTVDLIADITKMNNAIEQDISRSPEQYMWFLKIFETQEGHHHDEGLYEEGIKRIRQGLSPLP